MALRGAEGDHLSERSEGGKLPQLWPRCLRRFAEAENLKRVLRGECRGGQGAKPRRSVGNVNTTGNQE